MYNCTCGKVSSYKQILAKSEHGRLEACLADYKKKECEMQKLCGWVGKILKIDLSHHQIETLDTMAYAEKFLGGLGIGHKLYWDHAAWGADAFDERQPLIFMTGPLSATPAPSAPRLSICGKSPCIYPETFVSASLGGFFAAELKKAGFDGIMVLGRSGGAVTIHIEDGNVELREAAQLWGLGNLKTHEVLKNELGKNVRILSIGPGGENRTRYGIIFTDVAGAASMGFGSVMGSKNLKAITVKGSGSVSTADPVRIKEIRKRFSEMTGAGYYNLFGNPILLPGMQVIKKAHCHGCPQGCWRTVQQGPSGSQDIRKCQTNLFYSLWDRKLHGAITEASFSAATLANDYGLCVLDLVQLMLWLDRCFAAGLLSEKDIGLPMSQMGSPEFFETLMRTICSRRGFGSVLAEGAIRASENVGGEAREIIRNMFTQTGRAVAYGPKVFVLSALIYALEPRPFITELHEVCEPLTKWGRWYTKTDEKSYMSTDVIRRIGAAFWGGEKSVDFSTYEGKARASALIQNRQYIKESLVLCDFAWPVYDDASTQDHVGDPGLECKLLSSVTGWDIDEAGLNRFAERIIALNRAILLREGRRGRQDDILPEFFFIERDEFIADVFGMHNPQLLLPGAGDDVISRRGKAVDREQFEKLLDDYYGIRGWDEKTGYLKKETLVSLELPECIEPLGDKAI